MKQINHIIKKDNIKAKEMKKKMIGFAIFALIASSCNNAKETPKAVSETVVSTENAGVSSEKAVVEMNKKMFTDSIMDIENANGRWAFKGNKPTIIDFYATWCGPCKAIAPIMEEIAQKYGNEIDVYKVDVDQNEELAAYFEINSIPTLLFIPKEGEPVTIVGGQSKGEIEALIKEHFGK